MLRSQLLHRYCYRLFIQFLPVVTDFGGTHFCVYLLFMYMHMHMHMYMLALFPGSPSVSVQYLFERVQGHTWNFCEGEPGNETMYMHAYFRDFSIYISPLTLTSDVSCMSILSWFPV